ncbi:MAG: hypothetical protein GEU79_13830, partial [Acidimicrobiia bacterium]|nr:hypothetical protein [Acidimicrobiia bacterium]
MSDGSLESLEILGVSVFSRPPIGTLHLPLQRGLHILYGKNGAGKTRTLEAVQGALTNATELEQGVWVHVRVVDDTLPGVLVADDYFREALFFELSDSLVQSLHYMDPTPSGFPASVRLERLWEYIPPSGESDIPDSIQGLVTAIAWLHAIDEIERAAPEIHRSCYLSIELGHGRARVFLSSMKENTPLLSELGRIAVALNRGSMQNDWDSRSARQFRPPSAPTDYAVAEITGMISNEVANQLMGTDDKDAVNKLLRAAAALEPRFEFFHHDRPSWAPTPLLSLCGGLEAQILNVWEDRQHVDPKELAQLTLLTLDTSDEESLFEETSNDDATGITATPHVKARLAQLGDSASNRLAALLK